MRKFLVLVLLCGGLLETGAPRAWAQAGPKLGLERIISGLNLPVFVTAPPGDTNRLFIIEQHLGQVRILHLADRTLEPASFLTVPGVTTSSEQGLLGLAFHPNYASNGWFFVNYTTTGGGAAGHTEIVRYRVQGDPTSSNVADPRSKEVLLTYDQPEANHNAGWVGFGPDGYLYIAAGDGGGANDQHGAIGNGQNRSTFLGKILRIDVDHGSPYAIPSSNPFAGDSTKTQEIFAFGLRNPWRCSFDRQTGRLWIGDVGQDAREEVDVIPPGAAGLNFGWRPREGLIQTPAHPTETPVTPRTDPTHDYSHSVGECIIGGYVYRGAAIPGLQGTYFFGDYVAARFWSFSYDGTNVINLQERTAELNAGTPKPITQLSSFGEDASGELYLCDLADGEIYRIVATSTPAPSIQLSGALVRAQDFIFRFSATPGRSYVVESRAALGSGTWQTVTNLVASSSTADVLVEHGVKGSVQFYRVRTE